jgi:hypothetical protein
MIIQPGEQTLASMLNNNNWEILKKTPSMVSFRHERNAYDCIEVYTEDNVFRVVTPMVTSRYAYSTRVSEKQGVFDYLHKFVQHYNEMACTGGGGPLIASSE